MPEIDETVAIDVSAAPSEVQSLFERVRALPIAPLALELVSAERGATLLVRLAGNADSVRAQRRTLEAIGALRDAAPNVWEMLRTREGSDSAVLRFRFFLLCVSEAETTTSISLNPASSARSAPFRFGTSAE